MITTTLNRIREHRPCREGWEKLLAGIGKTRADDEPLPFARIVEINGIDDALWCCRAEPQRAREWRLFAIWCARRALALIPSPDPRSVAAVDIAERHARGEASDEELAAAERAATFAARDAASDAARDAARAARDAAWAAWDAARAARAAAWDARAAAWDARAAARDAERDAQQLEFLRIVGEG